jgi:hypothetical protein
MLWLSLKLRGFWWNLPRFWRIQLVLCLGSLLLFAEWLAFSNGLEPKLPPGLEMAMLKLTALYSSLVLFGIAIARFFILLARRRR